MNPIESLAQNTEARLDASRDLREAKELLKALNSQWDDIMKEIEDHHWMVDWMEFCGIMPKEEGDTTKTQKQIIEEWEAKNPQWEVIGSGLRRRKGGAS